MTFSKICMFKVDAPRTLCTHAGVKMTMEKRSNKCWRSVSVYLGSQRHVHLISQEMRYITKRMRDKDEEDVVINDWKFAAMVIDRWSRADKVKRLKKCIFSPDFVCLASLSTQSSQRSYFSHLRLTLWSPKEVVRKFNPKIIQNLSSGTEIDPDRFPVGLLEVTSLGTGLGTLTKFNQVMLMQLRIVASSEKTPSKISESTF